MAVIMCRQVVGPLSRAAADAARSADGSDAEDVAYTEVVRPFLPSFPLISVPGCPPWTFHGCGLRVPPRRARGASVAPLALDMDVDNDPPMAHDKSRHTTEVVTMLSSGWPCAGAAP